MEFVKHPSGAMAAAILAALVVWQPSLAQTLETLELRTASGATAIAVEIAATEASREHGLMNRRFLPPGRGMLFEFEREEPVEFWMKDTLIPLDMIFIAHDGRIVRIAENAQPLSQALVASGAPCDAVLELNGGAAAGLGLKVGDTVRHAFFKP